MTDEGQTPVDTNPFLIDAVALAARLDEPGMRIVDASWYLPTLERDARAEYVERRVPGTVFFDIDAIADTTSGLPHTLASPAHFAASVGALGIAESDTIVCYDGLGLFSAARAWWNFRLMGARDVLVLDGGLPAWIDAGLPLESGATPPATPVVFTLRPTEGRTCDIDAVRAHLAADDALVIDVRGARRFAGLDPEPRAGMRSGEMPGSVNLPYERLLENGRLRSVDELAELFAEIGVSVDRPIVTSCGSGVTAAIAALALESLGRTDQRLYDGSWAEWGGRSDTPVATGP